MFSILKEFIEIPTIAHDKEKNQEGIKMVFDLLEGIGFSCETKGESPYHQPVIVAKRPGNEKKIVIYGHYDVEKIKKPAAWDMPPFELSEIENRLYGRGIADNKGIFIARYLGLKEMIEKGEDLPTILWVLQGEEEIEGKTAFDIFPPLFEDFGSRIYLEETGFNKNGQPLLFYLPEATKGDFLEEINQTVFENKAKVEYRALNKFSKCPFRTSLPQNTHFFGFGPNDPKCNIHRPNESLDKELLEKHISDFQKFMSWVAKCTL